MSSKIKKLLECCWPPKCGGPKSILCWPVIKTKFTKSISLALFIVTVFTKVLDVWTVKGQEKSHCIAGWEITENISIHAHLLLVSIVPDVCFIVLIPFTFCFFKKCNFGADPGTIVYNFIVGALCMVAEKPIFVIEECGNKAIPIVKSVGYLSVLAGFCHIVNGFVCLLFLAPEERVIPAKRPPPSARSTMDPEDPRHQDTTDQPSDGHPMNQPPGAITATPSTVTSVHRVQETLH